MGFNVDGPTSSLHNSTSKSSERIYHEQFDSLVMRCYGSDVELWCDSAEGTLGFSSAKKLSELSANGSVGQPVRGDLK